MREGAQPVRQGGPCTAALARAASLSTAVKDGSGGMFPKKEAEEVAFCLPILDLAATLEGFSEFPKGFTFSLY